MLFIPLISPIQRSLRQTSSATVQHRLNKRTRLDVAYIFIIRYYQEGIRNRTVLYTYRCIYIYMYREREGYIYIYIYIHTYYTIPYYIMLYNIV